MAKRGASSDLNHTNWDREDEPEDSGMFSKASEDVIKRRVIKVAKRRNPLAHMSEEEEKPKAFGGFTAFSKTPSSNFSFLSNLNSSKPASSDDAKKTNGKTAESPSKDAKQDEYYAKLKGLNESVVDWIKTHVSKNPFVNLQPIFKDYDKYFEELEKAKLSEKSETTPKAEFKFGVTTQSFGIASKNTTSPSNNSTSIGTIPTTVAPMFQFTSSSAPKFPFGNTTTTTNTTQPSGFQFGNTSTGTSSATTLSLSSNASVESSKPLFSFGSVGSSSKPIFPTKPPSDEKETTSEEPCDEDQPPKVEFTPVVEEGHVYTIRCKVFVKKDGGFGDRGVGNLYLKSVPDSEKYQLIVRADTNLGNLLCNFILSEGIPTQRMGKKDVMLVCIPTPDTAPPPVPILLRVKTTEDADELLKTLEKYKK